MAVRYPGLSLAFILLCLATTWTSGGAQQQCEDSCVNGECDQSGICQCFEHWYGTNCSQFACELGANPCRNKGICVNSPTNDSFTCDCPDDYGGPLCAYYEGPDAVILCESSTDADGEAKCDGHGTCVLEEGIETCLCNAGRNGTMCEIEFDPCLSREGCHNGGICTNVNFLTCECPHGYDPGTQCLYPFADIRLCDTDPPCQNNATCSYPVPIPVNGLPYVCNCTQGFTGVNCGTLICDELECQNGGVCNIDHCDCPLGWKGDVCSIEDDPCVEVECKNSGNCTHNTTATSCICPPTFTGDNCGEDVDECATGDVCKNDGECFNLHGGYVCLCAYGYTGPTCEELVDHCHPNPCQNSGICKNELNGYLCECSGAHVGLRCEILREDTCESEGKQCYFGGECVESPEHNRHICNCSHGYAGEFCLYQYQPCEQAGCYLAGTSECAFEGGLPSCHCKVGFTGLLCDTETACASHSCENGGTCHADGSSYSCDCPPGYTGDKCQSLIYSECAGPNLDCVHGSCFQLLGEEFCKCAAGWGGFDCSFDVNECSQFPCQNGGTCSNTFGGYTCDCPAGYEGEDCSMLVGSCNPNPCQNGGSCIPGPSPVCSCQPGYTGSLCETDDCTNNQCPAMAGNGVCDVECFTAGCGFDGGRDCFTPSGSDPWVTCSNRDYCLERYNNGYCDQECNNGRCLYDGNDCLPKAKNCSEEMIATCTTASGNGVCDKECNTAECYTYDEDCVGQNLYLPNLLVMVLASMDEDAFEGEEAENDFLADLGDVIHAKAELIGDIVRLSESDIDDLEGVTYNSRYYYWRVTLRIDIYYCEASCPTSIDQVLGSIDAAYSSGRTSIGDFEVVDAYGEEESSTLDTQAIAFYTLLAVSLVLVVVVVGILGKRVRDNGGVKAVVKKIRVRYTWQVPGGATPEPVSSPLTRGPSLTSDGRSSSIEPILDPSSKKEGFPHYTVSRIEVPVPGGGPDRTYSPGQSGKDDRSWTHFHCDAAHQSSDVLKHIVTDGLARNGSVVDINAQGPGGYTPLMVAIVAEKGPWRTRSCSGHAVRSDSSSGSEHSEHDFLLSSSSHSSPHLAMRRMGKREMPESRVAALMTPETDVNLTNDQGQTALHLAVFHSRGDYVQVLLAAKADPNIQDIWGQSPLHVAIGAAAEGAFKVLLDHPKTNIELKSQGGITPLMMTVMMVNQYMVKVLVQRNADIAATDSEGRTAVHWAAMLNNIEALKLLVRQGPDNVKDASNSKGETALFLACREGCTESVRHLLDCFANTTLLDNLERSPLQIAHEKQNRDIVEMLQQTSQGHIVPPPPYMKHMPPAHSATSSCGMFVRMPGGIKMEPGLQAASMHPTVTYPSTQHQAMYHPPQENVPLTFGDFSMGRQSSVERALDYLVESTMLNSQPPTDHSPSLRLTHPSDSPPYMATASYADPSNQPQSSASMMHGSGVVQDMNHSSPSHPVISPGMQPGASMGGVSYSSTGSCYDPVSSTTSGVFASHGEMESLTTFSPSTVSASNQPIMTHHTLNNVGSKPLQHLPYHGAYSVAPTMPATSINPMATSEGQYLPSISSGRTVASSVEQSVQQSQGYDNANMHPSLSPLSAQTVSPNSQALHMPQAQHSGFSPNTAPPLSAGENKSPYSYGFPSPPKGPDDYSYSGASYPAVVGDVNSLTPSPEDYSNCTATEHSPMRPQATVIHGHYAAQEQMYPGVQLYHDYTLQTHAQLQGAMNSSLKESTV